MEQLTLHDNSISRNLCGRASAAFLWLLFLLLPLGVHDTFHNASETKSTLVYALSSLYILSVLCITGLGKGEPGRKLHRTDLFFAVFVLVGILSSVLSGHGPEALDGSDNRRQGIAMFSLYLALFFALKRYAFITPGVKRSMFFAFSLVCILGMLNQFGADPAGYISALIEPDRVRFTSTIGNIGFYSAYCTLLFPAAYALFLNASSPKEGLLYGTVSILGALGTMASHTESSFIGLCAAFAFIPLCIKGSGIKRYFASMPVMLLCMKLYSLAVSATDAIPLSALTEAVLGSLPFGVLMAVFLLCGVLFHRLSDEGAAKFKKLYTALLCAGLAAALALVLWANFHPDKVPLSAAKYLVITPEWGTDRGRIWQGMAAHAREFTPLQKLIGGGFGCVARLDREHRLFSDAVIDAAHNEYLHYFLTHGMLGLAAYIAFIAASVTRCFRHGGTDGRCLCAGCLAYAAQAFVNIAQTFSTPLFFVFLFLLPLPSEGPPPGKGAVSPAVSCIAMLLAAAACFAVGMSCTVPA